MSNPQPVYLDHNATTPVADEVREAMIPWLGARFGNPSSGHPFGRDAADAVANGRAQVASIIGAKPEQIVFTGGGTEADNLAVRCSKASRQRIVTSAVEHPAIEQPAEALANDGWTWDSLAVDARGRVDLDAARQTLNRPTGLLSVILAQNELGVVQPVAELAAMARTTSPEVIVHSDAAQAVGKIPVDVNELGVDLLTIVSHKLYGPCGIGALFVARPGLVEGWALGGGQERGVRPGTEPVAMIVGLAEAARIAQRDLDTESSRQAALRERLWERLAHQVPGIVRTVGDAPCLPNTLHVCFPNCQGRDVLANAPEVAASTGSACHTDGGGGGVFGAMGLAFEIARGAVRLSLGRSTDQTQVDLAADALARAWQSGSN